jgi:stage II sporulation SpoD-like protein
MRAFRVAVVVALVFAEVSASASDRVRVLVMSLFHPHQFVVESAPGQLLILTAGQRQIVIGAGARKRVSLIRSGRTVHVKTGETDIVADEVIFTGQHGDADFVLSVPDKLRRTYHGKLSVRGEGRELAAVVEMELETVVASIVAAESPGDAPLEALKAQAVVSRSYLVAGRMRHLHAEFCDTTHCQFLRNPPRPGTGAAVAAETTKGLVLSWRGKPFPAMYSASCGGRTHSLAEIGLEEHDYPYFPVECRQCRRSPEAWSSALTERDAGALDNKSERSRIKAGRKLGWSAVPSNTFSAKHAKGAVEITGSGRGHGVGLCQRGASGMAREGKAFRAILEHYFPNTTVESLALR